MSGTLCIRCVEAKYLPAKNTSNGYSDPYVKFKLNGGKFKTKIIQRCLHPVWGEDFVVPIHGDTLSLSIWDANRFSQNKFIGSCEIDLKSVEKQGGKLTAWYPVADAKGALISGAVLLVSLILERERELQEAGKDLVYAKLVLDRALLGFTAGEEKKEHSDLSLQMVTWNAGNHPPSEDLSALVPRSRVFDLVAVGLQESRYQTQVPDGSALLWIAALTKHLGAEYFSVGSQFLWEIGLCVFAHRKHFSSIHSVETKVESTGVGHVMGNKGGVAISFCHNDLSLCFVTSHLAAQMTKRERRNRDVAEIIGGTKMGFKAQTDILNQYHHVFWMGDLNYRLDYGNEDVDSPSREVFSEVVDLIRTNQLAKLFACDQLTKERVMGNVFAGFQEGTMTHIPPTFKVERKEGCVYNAQRCPAWTDRILWKSLITVSPPRQVFLNSAPLVSTSDHKPLLSVFELSPYIAPIGFDNSVGECAIVFTSLEGNNLRAADTNGLSDPFIYFFSSFTESIKTSIMSKTLNPVWLSKDLPTAISFTNSRQKLRQSFLKVVALDQDRASKDDEIGYGVLYLEALSAAKPNTDVSFGVMLTFEGLPAGQLTGTFQLQFTAVGEQRPRRKSLLTPAARPQVSPGATNTAAGNHSSPSTSPKAPKDLLLGLLRA